MARQDSSAIENTPNVGSSATSTNAPVSVANNPTVTIATCASGPTSGEESEDEVARSSICVGSRVVFDNNQLRPMSSGPCKKIVRFKTDLMRGDSLVMKAGNVISGKEGRVEVGLCKRHYDHYLERRKDVGCEQAGCYAKGVLVKIGNDAIRECNGHIGMRLLKENQSEKDVEVSHMNLKPAEETKGVVLAVNDDGSTQCGNNQNQIDEGTHKPIIQSSMIETTTGPAIQKRTEYTRAVNQKSQIDAPNKEKDSGDKSMATIVDPAEAEPETASDAEEEFLE